MSAGKKGRKEGRKERICGSFWKNSSFHRALNLCSPTAAFISDLSEPRALGSHREGAAGPAGSSTCSRERGRAG